MTKLRAGEKPIQFIARTAKVLRRKNKRLSQRDAISKASEIYRLEYKIGGKAKRRKSKKNTIHYPNEKRLGMRLAA